MLPFAWEDLAIILLALAAGGLTKGLTGMGLPLITVPVLAGFLGVERAVLVMIIPSVVLNAYQALTHRDQTGALPEWRRLVLAGIPGAAFGATVLHLASERFLLSALGTWLLGYVGFRLLHPSFALSWPTRQRWSPAVGASAGALQAATGISAPIIASYMDALGLTPRAYVFAVCMPFGAFATAHLALVLIAGVYTPDVVSMSLFAVIPALAAIPVGVWLRRFVSPKLFELLVRFTLVVMALRLFYMALMDTLN